MTHPASVLRAIVGGMLASAFLTGCALPGSVSAPTPYPADYIPTAVYLTALSIDASTQTAIPSTSSPTVTSTFIPPTIAPADTPTPGPQVPLAAIQVRAPGPMSRIVSPMRVQLLAIAGDSRRVEIAIFGEDGRLLGRTLVAVAGSSAGDPISVKMPFEIRAAGEAGFLQVSTRNLRGDIQSLITVPVLLLSAGTSQINPPGNTIYARVALADLLPEEEVAGSELAIAGQVLPYNDNPVIMELMTEEGQGLSLRVVNVELQDWEAVVTTLPFDVTRPTAARLYVRQADTVIPGDAFVFSQPLMLMP